MIFYGRALSLFFLAFLFFIFPAFAREMDNLPIVKLQSLDKITARTMTFEAKVGGTVKFGPLYIKTQACRKAPPVEAPEAAAFLQIWEMKPQPGTKEEKPEWVFSGWMFASSPGLSYMDHPVYDVWVLDCLDKKSGEKPDASQAKPGEGEVPESNVPAAPSSAPPPAATVAPEKPAASPTPTAPPVKDEVIQDQ